MLKDFYYQMVLIRKFEERMLELFSKGELFGTTHAYIGQEAGAVAVMNNLEEQDIVFSNHRCHGHYLARTGDVEGLMAELMGKEGGICGGRGGSQHLCKSNFYTNGIQGSIVPVAAGMAFAEKIKKTEAITALFIGDGTLGQGIVYETFNLVSLWKVPILIIIENNRYAQSTPLKTNFAGSMVERARGFAINAVEIESNDVEQLNDIFAAAADKVRKEQIPMVQVIHTYRLCSHSKSDDNRPVEEIDAWRSKDPLLLVAARIDKTARSEIETRAIARIEKAEETVRGMDFPSLNNGRGKEVTLESKVE